MGNIASTCNVLISASLSIGLAPLGHDFLELLRTYEVLLSFRRH
jgi:hypothetical protein